MANPEAEQSDEQLAEFEDITAQITYSEEDAYPVASGGYSDIFKARFNESAVAVKVMRELGIEGEKKRRSLSRVRIHCVL